MTGFYHLRGDTLAGIKTSALFLTRSMASQPLPEIMKRVNAYMEEKGDRASPEGEAFKFYFANHAFSVIASKFDQNEPLPEDVLPVARGYVKLGSDLVVRLAYYCLLICTREARHMYKDSKIYASISAKCGPEVGQFIKSICGHGEGGAVNMLRHSPPSTTLGQYVSGLTQAFFEGQWAGGFGGPAWGKVAETLRQLVYGVTSPEMFADTAFTLAHNNGPIFNKGMLYTGYSHFIYKLLDVQRSGQVPQLYEEEDFNKKILAPESKEFVSMARKVFTQELTGYVDWYKVEGLGALHKYHHEKAKQNQKHGVSKFASEMDKKEAKKFYIAPDQYVMMVEREAA